MTELHALVVDDNLSNLRVLVQLLAKQGVRATEVSNPEALAALMPTLPRVEVVFLDLEMPGLSGYDVKDLLREHLTGVPIIAYTVHISEMNTVHEMGFDGFLGKPLDSSRFPEMLSRILRGESVWERA